MSNAKNLHIVFSCKHSVETKIEANFRIFVPKHFSEENTLSILFAGTGNFLFDSLSQNAAAENFKNCARKKTTFEVQTNHLVEISLAVL
jgi:hypothetical protein